MHVTGRSAIAVLLLVPDDDDARAARKMFLGCQQRDAIATPGMLSTFCRASSLMNPGVSLWRCVCMFSCWKRTEWNRELKSKQSARSDGSASAEWALE